MIIDFINAFFMGILSFISPCVLPLIPIYIFYITGLKASEKIDNKNIYLFKILMFIIGFSLIYVFLGLLISILTFFANQAVFKFNIGEKLISLSIKDMINIFFGIIIIIFSLHFMGIIKIFFLNVDTRMNVDSSKKGFFSPLLMGMAFAAGWSPCTGPFLGSVLGLVASRNSIGKGVFLLIFYSLGIGIPLIITALFFNYIKPFVDFLKRNSERVKLIGGIFLLLFGILMIFGLFGNISSYIFKFAYFLEDSLPLSNYIFSSIIISGGLFFIILSLILRKKYIIYLSIAAVLLIIGVLSIFNVLPVINWLIKYLTYTGA
ncbi:MAG: hypothetical protein JXB50_09175 [Spirochaetes bacterium]|nr:hypothetical protein [Spirochaetota bacterium]